MKRVVRWMMRLAVISIVCVALVVWLTPESVLPLMARFLDVSDSPRPSDYVLILNGDPEVRPFAAAAYVKAGLAKQVLLTRQRISLESATVQEGAMPSEFEITRKILLIRGVPEVSIKILPGEITSTADEAHDLAVFLDENPQATVTIVTNAFHTRRARLVFQRVLGDHVSCITFAGLPRDDAEEDHWWRTPGGCTVYATEYLKLVYYWFRY